MKNIILTITCFFMLLQLAAQNGAEKDSITIFINTKKIVEYSFKPGDETAMYIVKKAAVKKLKHIAIQVKGSLVSNARYARSLEIAENNILSVNETKDNPGYFDIANASFNKMLLSGKKIPLYLMLNPANPMIMIPSKRIFLGNLVMK